MQVYLNRRREPPAQRDRQRRFPFLVAKTLINVLRPHADVGRILLARGFCNGAEHRIELLHSKPATTDPRTGYGLKRDRDISEEGRIGNVDLVDDRVLVRVVGDDQHERSKLRSYRIDRHRKLHRRDRSVIFDVAAIDDAVDDVMLGVAHRARRGNYRKPRRICCRRAQADIIKVLFLKIEREFFADVLPQEVPLDSRPEIDIGVVGQQRVKPGRLHEDRAFLTSLNVALRGRLLGDIGLTDARLCL